MRSTNPAIWRILPTREIASEWDRLCSVSIAVPFRYEVKTSGPVKATWWNPAWVPIAECGTGDVVCIDLDPSGGGAIGQIILYQHDYEERKVLHTCLLDWLRECADDLDHGKYVYADGIGIVERSAGSPNPH
jgi:cell wall assembly regulator SMI1